MADQQQIENAVVATLMYNRPTLLNIISPLLLQKQQLLSTEDSSFHSEIETQFEALIRREIAETIAINQNFDPEQVFLIVETLNVSEFIGQFVPEPEDEDEV